MPAPLRKRLEARVRDRQARPLAYARLWHNDNCSVLPEAAVLRHSHRSSQRLALTQPVDDALAVLGGNGAGKSVLGAQVAVAVLFGREDPMVARWIEANDICPELIPPGGAPVVASSLTSELSLGITRPKIAEFLPPGRYTWRNREGVGTSVLTADNGHTITFKSDDQGWEKYQGISAGLVWLDEEHDQRVYRECERRTGRVRWDDRSGWLLLTLTPIKGKTWVYDTFASESPQEGTAAHWIWGEDNPHIDQAKRLRHLADKSVSEAQRLARDRGAFGNPEGLVFSRWDRAMVSPALISCERSWVRYDSIDFGTRNPFCWLFAAYSPSTETLYILREHHQAETLIRDHVEVGRLTWQSIGRDILGEADTQQLEEAGRARMIWADPEDKQSRKQMALQHGITTAKAIKGYEVTLQASMGFIGPPARLVVDPRCGNFIREIEGYQWDPVRTKADAPPRPLKKNDHAMDCYRYLSIGVSREHSLG